MIAGFRHLRIAIAIVFLTIVLLAPVLTLFTINTHFRDRVLLEEGSRLTQSMKSFQQGLDQEFQRSQLLLSTLGDRLEGVKEIREEEGQTWSTKIREFTASARDTGYALYASDGRTLGNSGDQIFEPIHRDIIQLIRTGENVQSTNEYLMLPSGLSLVSLRRINTNLVQGWLVAAKVLDQKYLRLMSSERGMNIAFIEFGTLKADAPWKVLLSSRATSEYIAELDSIGSQGRGSFVPLERDSSSGSYIAIASPFGLEAEGRKYGFILDIDLAPKFSEIKEIEISLIVILVGSLLLASLALFFFNRTLFHPIILVKDGLKHLSQFRFPPMLPLESGSEVGALVTQYNSATKSLDRKFKEMQASLDDLEDRNFALDREIFEKDMLRKIAVYTNFETDRKSSIGKICDILMDAYGCPYALIHEVEPNTKELSPIMAKLLEPQTDRILTSKGAVFVENLAVPDVISEGNLILREFRANIERYASESVRLANLVIKEKKLPSNNSNIQIVAIPITCDDRVVSVINLLNRPEQYSISETDEKFIGLVRSEVAEILYRAKQNDIVVMDPLTHLFNSRYFEQRLTSEVLRARRNSQPISLLVMEIDEFNKFSERNEDQIAEEVVRSMAALLRGVCRTTDVIARLEGGVFAIILPDTPSEGASVVSEKIRSRSERIVTETKRGPVTVTVSIGVSVFPDQASIPKDLTVLAFDALESSKSLGGNKSSEAQASVDTDANADAGVGKSEESETEADATTNPDSE